MKCPGCGYQRIPEAKSPEWQMLLLPNCLSKTFKF